MSAVQPVAVYALRIPPGDVLIPAVPEFAAMFRVTMAAIDPSEEVQPEDIDEKRPLRATLKVIRVADDMLDDDSEDDEDYAEDLDDEEDSSDEESNGGPSTKASRKQKLLEALAAEADNDDEDMVDEDDEDDEDDVDAAEEIKKIIAAAKGKGKAIEGESDDDEDDDSSNEGIELDECVICTLDPEKHYQQPIDFVVNEGEKIFFKVSGTHTVHLTGNYVMPLDDGQASLYDEEDDEDEEEEYDLSPDEDELDMLERGLEEGFEDDEESDALDDIADPRVTEVDSEEEATVAKKQPKTKKGKNKRPAEDSDDEESADLDAIMAKSIKKDEAVNGESQKLSKAEKKKAKKLKKNDGEAAPAATTPEAKKETQTNGSEKKVQFAKDIVQGPTPSATPPAKKDGKKEDKKEAKKADKKADKTEKNATGGKGVHDVQGVTVDDRKVGTGAQAKKGSKLEMRYIGKLKDGKVFDSNKSGPAFKVKVGVGEVIKGWDIGLVGISAGGERRLTIPAHLAYGNQSLPGIPKNSTLVFDVKCLSVK